MKLSTTVLAHLLHKKWIVIVIVFLGILTCGLRSQTQKAQSLSSTTSSAAGSRIQPPPEESRGQRIEALIRRFKAEKNKEKRMDYIRQLHALAAEQEAGSMLHEQMNPKGTTLIDGAPSSSHGGSLPGTAEVVPVYHLPFGSNNSRLELTVSNSSSAPRGRLTISASNTPPWMNLSPTEQALEVVNPPDVAVARFTLEIHNSAPVRKAQLVTLSVMAADGHRWKREFTIIVDPPKSFEVFQNYPNPFNPSTTISYLVPQEARISVAVYSLLGQKVANLIQEIQSPGYHSVQWNADYQGSGIYIVRLLAEDLQGKAVYWETKKILLMR